MVWLVFDARNSKQTLESLFWVLKVVFSVLVKWMEWMKMDVVKDVLRQRKQKDSDLGCSSIKAKATS